MSVRAAAPVAQSAGDAVTSHAKKAMTKKRKPSTKRRAGPRSADRPAEAAAPTASAALLAAQGAAVLAAFLVSLDYTAITVALPTLATDFGVGTSAASWASLSYMLAMVILTPIAGATIGRIGLRRGLIAAFALFTAASLGASQSEGLVMLVAMRGLQGVGASVMFFIGPAILKEMVPADRQSRAFAILSASPMVGLAAGPTIGGALTSAFGWQSVLLINLPLGALGIVLALSVVSGRTAPSRAAPLPSPVAMILGIATLGPAVLLLNQGQEWGWTSLPILLLGAFALLAGVAFVRNERGTRTGLVDRKVLASHNFRIAAAIFSLILIVFGGVVFLMPFYLQWGLDLSAAAAGRVLAAQPLMMIAVSLAMGFGLASLDPRRICRAGILLVAVGTGVIAASPVAAGWWLPLAGLALIGAGVGLYYPTLMQLGLSDVPRQLSATASSLQATVRVAAQMFGIVIFETLLSGIDPRALDATKAAAMTAAERGELHTAAQITFAVGAAVALLSLLPAARLAGKDGAKPAPAKGPPPARRRRKP